MAGKKLKKLDVKRLPPEKILPGRNVVEVGEEKVELRKLNEIAGLIRLSADLDEEEKNSLIVRALDLYESIAPRDGMEGMLAAQMVGTHHAALDCLRRAAHPEQGFEARDMYFKHAEKLMGLYAKQMAALEKRRGGGQQKVTVEHVHVEAGGQAIVGNVKAGEKSNAFEEQGTFKQTADESNSAARHKSGANKQTMLKRAKK